MDMKRFWSKVVKNTKTGCWEWQAAKTEFGYGLFRLNKKSVRAHRLSWELTNGIIPDGLCILHKCDNPACCNPEHLFLGTKKDNAHDRMTKGRPGSPGPRVPLTGEKHQNTKLTTEQVLKIRELSSTMTQRAIAKMFGMKFQSVHSIVSKRTWRTV